MTSRGSVVMITLLLSLLCSCNAYKILIVFPIPSGSHAILGEGYVKHLASAGHEITYITPLPMKNPPQGVRQIDISENKKFMPVDVIFDTRSLINQELDLQGMPILVEIFLAFGNGTLHIDGIQKLLDDVTEQFDLVIVEWLYTEILAGIATVFNCPLIWSSSMEPHFMVLPLIDEYPNPAYSFHHLSKNRGFSFWNRVKQLWFTTEYRLIKRWWQNYENQLYSDIYKKFVNKRGRVLPSYDEVKYNASLMLGNSYIATGDAISLPQSYKPIGGYHIEKDPRPLPKDLQKIMDDSKHGVIYFSLGSMLQSSRIPEQIKIDLINMFGALKQTVIWKLEEVLSNLPKNVHILPWAPQTSILAHPNCKLFITHGGLLSQTEALHHAVPMIAIPQYADQFTNADRAESKGLGKRVDIYKNGPKKLDIAIREILGNSTYQENAKKYSFVHHHRPIPPEKELVHWVEHVIKTGGALHLRSPALHVPWYQKFYLDLAAVILLLILIIIRLYKYVRVSTKRYIKEKTT